MSNNLPQIKPNGKIRAYSFFENELIDVKVIGKPYYNENGDYEVKVKIDSPYVSVVKSNLKAIWNESNKIWELQ